MAIPIPLRLESRASFLFQKVNQHCLDVVTRASGSTMIDPSNFLDWYMPYNIHSHKEGRAANSTSHEFRDIWHISAKAHTPFNQMMRLSGQVHHIWDDVQDTSRNLESYVFYIAPTNASLLDLDLLQWISPVEVNYPSLAKRIVHIHGTYDTKDLVTLLMCLGEPMSVIAWRIGFIEANTIVCVALEVVLYLSRLHFRCYCHSFRHGSRVPMVLFVEIGELLRETYEQRMQHPAKSED